MKKYLLLTLQIVVGLLFIFSGLIKANDPLGLSYKMQEFFEVWNMPWLNAFSLGFSVLMIAFEILAGMAVILGWRMNAFAWLLLLLIIFFSFLTGYAVISGKVRECGCFGNCIPLQAVQSFIKDLILLVLIVVLFYYRKQIQPVFPANICVATLSLTLVFSFALQWYTLRYLPVIDCLPFKKGANIPQKMLPPAGAIPDSSVIRFVYEKNHQTQEYAADHLPEDLDSSYVFIKRYDKLIRKGNAEPEIKDFSLVSETGQDSTQEILNRPGYQLMLISRSFRETNPAWNKDFAVILSVARAKQIPVILVSSDVAQATAWLDANNLRPFIPFYGCDATAVKTAARADPTLYLLKKGTIADKWSYAHFNLAILKIAEIAGR